MNTTKITRLIVALIIVLLIVMFGLKYFGYYTCTLFAPRVENTQHKIFNQTPMHMQGGEQQFHLFPNTSEE